MLTKSQVGYWKKGADVIWLLQKKCWTIIWNNSKVTSFLLFDLKMIEGIHYTVPMIFVIFALIDRIDGGWACNFLKAKMSNCRKEMGRKKPLVDDWSLQITL